MFLTPVLHETQAPPGPDPVGWWQLEEGTGLITADSAPAGRQGDLTNMVEGDWVPGRPGDSSNYALEFSGNKHVDFGDHQLVAFNHDEPFTVTAHVKATNTDQMIAVSKILTSNPYRGWRFGVDNVSGWIRLHFYLVGTWAADRLEMRQSADGLSLDTWHHIALTYDGTRTASSVKMYLDAADLALTTIHDGLSGTATTVSNAKFVISGRNGASLFWSGTIDDVRIYDRVLDAAEIAQIEAERR